MTDPFIQRMKARNQARRNVLGLISEDISISNKENNKVQNKKSINDSSTINNSNLETERSQSTNLDKNASSSVIENSHGSGNPTLSSHSLSSTFHSPKKSSDSVLKVSSNINANRSQRFQHLSQRSKQMQEWEDDYTYHSEAQGFTPSPSRSKLGYDFRDRSPIKESVSSPSTDQITSSTITENIQPKIVSFQSKVNIQVKKTDTSTTHKERERDLSPSKVSDLRSQWEQHIRNASPDRQAQRSRSPSPVRNFVSRSRSPVKSATNISCQTNIQSPKSAIKKDSSRVSRHHGFQESRLHDEVIKGETPMPDAVPVVKNPTASVKERAAAFASLSEHRAPEKDPAELSVQDRLNLFEKRKGLALIPKAPFGQCLSEKVKSSDNSKSTISHSSKPENNTSLSPSKRDGNNEAAKESSCSSSLVGAQKMLFEKFEDNWKEADINVKTKTERDVDLHMLQNRFRRVPPSYSSQRKYKPTTKAESSDSEYPESEESVFDSDIIPSHACGVLAGPPKPPRTGLQTDSSPEFARPLLPGSSRSPYKRLNSTEIDESCRSSPRKEYVPKVKPGCLFPSLSDIESHSEAVDSDDECKDSSFAESVLTCASGESLGAKIQKAAQGTGNALTTRQLSVIAEKAERKLSSSFQSTSSSTLDELEAVEDAIDEALNNENEQLSSKRGRTTREDDERHNSVYKTPKLCKNSEPVNDSTENSLAHTISMYRKQKPAEMVVTPVRQIVRKADISSSPKDSPISPSVTISTRIRELQEEEEHQLTVISQASCAISVVSQHPEQHGTVQHIEAEKLLLVATQKRLCALHEIQRLKAEGALGKRNCWNVDDDSCRGSISISSIKLPLKTDFLNKLNERSIHHFVVLVKHRDQVITSELQATPNCIMDGAITFPNLISLHNLTADFNLSLEVYGFKVEPLSGVKKDHSRLKLTPLKRLQKESKSFSPAISSPGGPYSIRSSSFTLIGFANLNINTLTRNAWTLEKVPFSSPVNGHLLMHVNVTMEGGVRESSFLNMFEDVGGFGAWNRRWCVLRGPLIKYWGYPDDEFAKESIGKLDLRNCTTRRVELVSRDICARQHTFQLTFMRPLKAEDKSDLVHDIKNNTLISRILLSADSKEERILWCNKLNKSLANIRSWDPEALKPEDFQV